MNNEDIQPEQFEEIARAVVPQILSLIEDSGFTPPLEVVYTDADHRMICCLYMNAQNKFQDLSDTNRALRGRFPVDVSITDKNGKTWKTVFAAADLPSLD